MHGHSLFIYTTSLLNLCILVPNLFIYSHVTTVIYLFFNHTSTWNGGRFRVKISWPFSEHQNLRVLAYAGYTLL
jgi:hypothetical protein